MNVQEISDGELVVRYKEGEEQAFVTLLERHKNRLFSAVMMIVKDTYAAEDILQETFIKVIDTIQSGRYNEEGKFLPWISRIAHNLAIDHFRKNKRFPTIVTEDGHSVFETMEFAQDSFETVRIQGETCANLRDLIRKLPEPQKEVLIMRHYFQMSFQDIAQTTQVSINTALGRMRYALINLRKLIQLSEQVYADQKQSYQD
ncbi:MAG: sigma-70 family RNA polymerase sigma factor [Bernardetiaceae bacterium]|nr:sigma-70 family RNA polymerase sigma factor [Bernardetiaceae bacterium]